jgi:predicted CoA-binding protein
LSVIDEMLAKKVWAVVGVSNDKSKFGYRVYERLKRAGYTVYGVNPHLDELDGETVYPNLKSLPQTPDVVNFVVPPAVTETMIVECAGQGIKYCWLQPGSDSRKVLALARENKVEAHKRCVMTELRKRS